MTPSHRRLRRAIGRYADGELDATGVQAVATHLLECETCNRELATVRAIKGSLRRLADAEPPTLAATRLRRWAATLQNTGGLTPLRSQDCDRIAVGSIPDRPGAARRLIGQTAQRRVRRLAGVVVAAAGVSAALWVQQPDPAPDPRTVAALVELARLDSPGPADAKEESSARQGHTLQLGDQTVSLVRQIVDGREVLVAMSDRAFSMPADARPASADRNGPWLAKRGVLTIACLSRPTHMLLVGTLPPERLVEVGRKLMPGTVDGG
jgi:hypothetical protein